MPQMAVRNGTITRQGVRSLVIVAVMLLWVFSSFKIVRAIWGKKTSHAQFPNWFYCSNQNIVWNLSTKVLAQSFSNVWTPFILELYLQAKSLNKPKEILQSVGQRYDCPGPRHDPTQPGVGITSSQPPLPPYKQPAAAFFGTCSELTRATAWPLGTKLETWQETYWKKKR